MASQVLINITQEEREWARQLSEEKYILDRQSMLADARIEGLEIGRQEGRQEGRQKGLEEGKQEVARNLKICGVSIDIIAQSTGLSREEIGNL